MKISKGLSSGVITTVIYVVDHLKLVNGQSLNDCSILDEVEIATTLDLLRFTFGTRLQKISISSSHPVIKVNTKRLAGNLALTSVSSSRVFIDKVVQLTIAYFSWLVTIEPTVLFLSIPSNIRIHSFFSDPDKSIVFCIVSGSVLTQGLLLWLMLRRLLKLSA
ncbi:hypothetical protein YC2023_094757 [Brassica napus]